MPKRRRRKASAKHAALLKENRHRYDEILATQGGGCALCDRPPLPNRKLDMDHDHYRMYVRGLLCPRCNIALPDYSWITPEWLRRAADYLEKGPA